MLRRLVWPLIGLLVILLDGVILTIAAKPALATRPADQHRISVTISEVVAVSWGDSAILVVTKNSQYLGVDWNGQVAVGKPATVWVEIPTSYQRHLASQTPYSPMYYGSRLVYFGLICVVASISLGWAIIEVLALVRLCEDASYSSGAVKPPRRNSLTTDFTLET